MIEFLWMLFGRGFTVAVLIGLVYVFLAIFWQSITGLAAFRAECIDHGEFDDEDGCPDCDEEAEDSDAWDRGHDHWVREQVQAW